MLKCILISVLKNKVISRMLSLSFFRWFYDISNIRPPKIAHRDRPWVLPFLLHPMEKCIFKMQPPARISQSLAFLFLQLPLAMHLLPALFFLLHSCSLLPLQFLIFFLNFFFFLGGSERVGIGTEFGFTFDPKPVAAFVAVRRLWLILSPLPFLSCINMAIKCFNAK